ncbi:odorant receptor 13a-like [Nylanderia fulva]|uniref:odorant receptor 13a-like n=1 Tax=Nylanderia fulva TaxID=613905 RepID=UPI0010FBB906|nr:odorant receptor 13a-like [Nylanderia fulva]
MLISSFYILRFAELLENTYCIPFAIQIFIITTDMSVTLLQLSQQGGLILEKIRYVLYIIGQLIHLFLFSLEGQKLIDHSLQTRDKIYNSAWYKASVRSQKLIMMVMVKCLRPSFLSAGKIYIFSLESFTWVLQASMSYFTVLASFMRSLTRHLSVDWNEVENPEEYKIMKSYAENSRRFSMMYSGRKGIDIIEFKHKRKRYITCYIPFYYSNVTIMYRCLPGDILFSFSTFLSSINFTLYVAAYCLMATFTFMCTSLVPFALDFMLPLNQSRPVIPPYPGYYFVDVREYFLPIFCHSLVAWDILMIGIMAHDCMYVTYVEHVCSLFAVTGHRFERLFYNDRNQLTEVVDRNDMYYKRISFIVHTHRKSLKFAELLEDTFTIPFAIQILIVTMGMSITLLQISQENGPILEKIRYALYVIGQLIHLFLFSLEGQKLIDHSLQTREKIYNSSWYKASVRSQKLIMMVMIKCLRPSFLSAGKIYIFSLESFTTILQTSMSYFTVLASFQ